MKKKNFIIAIDGMSAAMKTSTANRLVDKLQKNGITANKISCDDFFLPRELRSEARIFEPGGNIHYERMKEEVINPLLSGQDVKYRKFDCTVMDFGAWTEVPFCQVSVIEGAYALNPFFGKYYDLSVFMKVSSQEQIQRIKHRNGDSTMFEQKWIPLEQRYFKHFNIEETADFVVDTTEYDSEQTADLLYQKMRRFL